MDQDQDTLDHGHCEVGDVELLDLDSVAENEVEAVEEAVDDQEELQVLGEPNGEGGQAPDEVLALQIGLAGQIVDFLGQIGENARQLLELRGEFLDRQLERESKLLFESRGLDEGQARHAHDFGVIEQEEQHARAHEAGPQEEVPRHEQNFEREKELEQKQKEHVDSRSLREDPREARRQIIIQEEVPRQPLLLESGHEGRLQELVFDIGEGEDLHEAPFGELRLGLVGQIRVCVFWLFEEVLGGLAVGVLVDSALAALVKADQIFQLRRVLLEPFPMANALLETEHFEHGREEPNRQEQQQNLHQDADARDVQKEHQRELFVSEEVRLLQRNGLILAMGQSFSTGA